MEGAEAYLYDSGVTGLIKVKERLRCENELPLGLQDAQPTLLG